MSDRRPSITSQDIAIVGMTGRFPKSSNLESFWERLRDGQESISHFSDAELRDSGVDPELIEHSDYVAAKAVLKDADYFDASFFGFNTREAEMLDPQHRIFLECAWEALESAGYDSSQYQGSIGIYAGASMNSYLLHNLYANGEKYDYYAVYVTNASDFLTTRVSYKLNLKGPSINVQTACSTSLVAVVMACQHLLSHQTDMALAGGVSILFPQKEGNLYQEGGITSPDGHCRAFDSRAQGTLGGEGVGIVVLKRMEDALADGDQIHAVIKGAAMNNDGATKIGYAAPSVEGQAEVIQKAQALAGVDPETITYVEAHGTATPLGDPIEVAALTQAFRRKTNARQYCGIGSIKTNIGHLDTAAGIAGLLKTVLALRHQLIPPSLHFDRPNPRIDFEQSPFYVVKELQNWKTNGIPRRAGVSSFGVGGTNAHVVLEEWNSDSQKRPSRSSQLLVLSAKTDAALDTMTNNLAEYLKENPKIDLADVAYTLQVGRKEFGHRRMVVSSSHQDAVRVLASRTPTGMMTAFHESTEDRPVIFLFPGQGAQYVNMGKELYQSEPIVREAIDYCATFLLTHLGLDLRSVLYPQDEGSKESTQILNETWVTQPALFVVEYAVSKLWQSWGINPQAMLGHSIGEFVAACLAGVFSLEDALTIISIRGRLMQSMPKGSMIAVRMSEKQVQPFLEDEVSLAAVNGPTMCVLSGEIPIIAKAQKGLEEKGIPCRPLHTSHAFHSSLIQPIRESFMEAVQRIKLNPPALPYVSNVTGTWVTESDTTDPEYWVKQACQTVQFSHGLRSVCHGRRPIFLEVGPGRTLSLLVKQQIQQQDIIDVMSSLRHPTEEQSDNGFLLNSLGRLWLAGKTIDWSGFYRLEDRRRISLPTYPFERKRYWIAPPSKSFLESEVIDQGFNDASYQSGLSETRDHQPMQPKSDDDTKRSGSSRMSEIILALQAIFVEVVGYEETELGVGVDQIDPSTNFFELGLDSLLLIQISQAIQQRFQITVPFRKLLEDCSTLDTLASFLCDQLPVEVRAVEESHQHIPSTSMEKFEDNGVTLSDSKFLPALESMPEQNKGSDEQNTRHSGSESALERVISDQLQIMSKQLELLKDASTGTLDSINSLSRTHSEEKASALVDSSLNSSEPMKSNHQEKIYQSLDHQRGEQKNQQFGPFNPVKLNTVEGLETDQIRYLNEFFVRYTDRTRKSKRLAQLHRPVLADVRGSMGFRMAWKELVYPISMTRAEGARLWDVDGNEYIDLVMGFGVNLLGHSPFCVTKALHDQLEKQPQYVGPDSQGAGDVAQIVKELTGMERVTFCNTGSEAVMSAIRVARTVTARSKIVVFDGSYHGNFDNVLVRKQERRGIGKSTPISLGIPTSLTNDVMVLDYDSLESLEFIKKYADEIAAVLVEPVQSRNPQVQPQAFLQELRKITEQSNIALIFDEMITGFRVHQGGAQAWFGVKADLATYGKIIGGGLPIGLLAGKAEYMDAIDGGVWSYGDDSFPSVNQTYFAGTFCKHPLVMAASLAVLTHLKSQGPQLQVELNKKTTEMAHRLNAFFEESGVPFQTLHCGSLFLFDSFTETESMDLLYYHLVERGVSVWGQRPYFLSTAHTEEDIEKVIGSVRESVVSLQKDGFLPAHSRSFVSGNGDHSLISSTDELHGSQYARSGFDHQHADLLAEYGENGNDGPKRMSNLNGNSSVNSSDAFKVPLTEAQQEIWLACQMGDDASCAYNTVLELELPGPFDLSIISSALEQVVERHDSLRSTFSREGDYLWVHSDMSSDVSFQDLSQEPSPLQQSQLGKFVQDEERRPFDLQDGPMFRCRVFKIAEEDHLLLLTTHHIVCDGWSGNILLDELKALYSSEDQRNFDGLPPSLPFSEYARIQSQKNTGDEGAADEKFWMEQFHGEIPVLDLPTDRPRPRVKTYNGARLRVRLEDQLLRNLRKLGGDMVVHSTSRS